MLNIPNSLGVCNTPTEAHNGDKSVELCQDKDLVQKHTQSFMVRLRMSLGMEEEDYNIEENNERSRNITTTEKGRNNHSCHSKTSGSSTASEKRTHRRKGSFVEEALRNQIQIENIKELGNKSHDKLYDDGIDNSGDNSGYSSTESSITIGREGSEKFDNAPGEDSSIRIDRRSHRQFRRADRFKAMADARLRRRLARWCWVGTLGGSDYVHQNKEIEDGTQGQIHGIKYAALMNSLDKVDEENGEVNARIAAMAAPVAKLELVLTMVIEGIRLMKEFELLKKERILAGISMDTNESIEALLREVLGDIQDEDESNLYNWMGNSKAPSHNFFGDSGEGCNSKRPILMGMIYQKRKQIFALQQENEKLSKKTTDCKLKAIPSPNEFSPRQQAAPHFISPRSQIKDTAGSPLSLPQFVQHNSMSVDSEIDGVYNHGVVNVTLGEKGEVPVNQKEQQSAPSLNQRDGYRVSFQVKSETDDSNKSSANETSDTIENYENDKIVIESSSSEQNLRENDIQMVSYAKQQEAAKREAQDIIEGKRLRCTKNNDFGNDQVKYDNINHLHVRAPDESTYLAHDKKHRQFNFPQRSSNPLSQLKGFNRRINGPKTSSYATVNSRTLRKSRRRGPLAGCPVAPKSSVTLGPLEHIKISDDLGTLNIDNHPLKENVIGDEDYVTMLSEIKECFKQRRCDALIPTPSHSSKDSTTGAVYREGIPEAMFQIFIAPAMTLSLQNSINNRLIARLDVAAIGFIGWDSFCAFFIRGDSAWESRISGSAAAAVTYNCKFECVFPKESVFKGYGSPKGTPTERQNSPRKNDGDCGSESSTPRRFGSEDKDKNTDACKSGRSSEPWVNKVKDIFLRLARNEGGQTTNFLDDENSNLHRHHAPINKILFSIDNPNWPSANPTLDGFCFTGGLDGAVHMWNSKKMVHVQTLQPAQTGANIQDSGPSLYASCESSSFSRHRFQVTDMTFSSTGKLIVSQSYGRATSFAVNSRGKLVANKKFRVGAKSQRMTTENEINEPSPGMFDVVLGSSHPGNITAISGLKSSIEFDPDIGTASNENDDGSSFLSGRSSVEIFGNGDIDERSLTAVSEPLLVGLDTGVVHLYDIHRNTPFLKPVATFASKAFLGKGRICSLIDDPINHQFLILGGVKYSKGTVSRGIARISPPPTVFPEEIRGNSIVQFMDYERMQEMHSITLTNPIAPHPCSRISYDHETRLIIGSGYNRIATVYSSLFGNVVTTLSDHASPVVGTFIHPISSMSSQRQLVVATEDRTFHIYDVRMFRKVEAVTMPMTTISQPFSALGYDGYRRRAVATSQFPVALSEVGSDDILSTTTAKGKQKTGINSMDLKKPKASDEHDVVTKTLSPSGYGSEMHTVQFNPSFGELAITEGSNIVLRKRNNGNTMTNTDSSSPLEKWCETPLSSQNVSTFKMEGDHEELPFNNVTHVLKCRNIATNMCFYISGRLMAVSFPNKEIDIISTVTGSVLSNITVGNAAPLGTRPSSLTSSNASLSHQTSVVPVSGKGNNQDEILCLQFARLSSGSPVLAVGTLMGRFVLYDQGAVSASISEPSSLGGENEGLASNELFSDNLTTSVVSVAAVGSPKASTHILVGTAGGAVHQYDIEFFRRTLIITFSHLHHFMHVYHQNIGQKEGNMTSVVTSKASSFRPRRCLTWENKAAMVTKESEEQDVFLNIKKEDDSTDSNQAAKNLMDFKLNCYQSMDRAVDFICQIDDHHVCIVYGTGHVLISRVGDGETISIFSFQAINIDTSASAVAFHKDTCLLVIGDFSGTISFFDLAPFFCKLSKSEVQQLPLFYGIDNNIARHKQRLAAEAARKKEIQKAAQKEQRVSQNFDFEQEASQEKKEKEQLEIEKKRLGRGYSNRQNKSSTARLTNMGFCQSDITARSPSDKSLNILVGDSYGISVNLGNSTINSSGENNRNHGRSGSVSNTSKGKQRPATIFSSKRSFHNNNDNNSILYEEGQSEIPDGTHVSTTRCITRQDLYEYVHFLGTIKLLPDALISDLLFTSTNSVSVSPLRLHDSHGTSPISASSVTPVISNRGSISVCANLEKFKEDRKKAFDLVVGFNEEMIVVVLSMPTCVVSNVIIHKARRWNIIFRELVVAAAKHQNVDLSDSDFELDEEFKEMDDDMDYLYDSQSLMTKADRRKRKLKIKRRAERKKRRRQESKVPERLLTERGASWFIPSVPPIPVTVRKPSKSNHLASSILSSSAVFCQSQSGSSPTWAIDDETRQIASLNTTYESISSITRNKYNSFSAPPIFSQIQKADGGVASGPFGPSPSEHPFFYHWGDDGGGINQIGNQQPEKISAKPKLGINCHEYEELQELVYNSPKAFKKSSVADNNTSLDSCSGGVTSLKTARGLSSSSSENEEASINISNSKKRIRCYLSPGSSIFGNGRNEEENKRIEDNRRPSNQEVTKTERMRNKVEEKEQKCKMEQERIFSQPSPLSSFKSINNLNSQLSQIELNEEDNGKMEQKEKKEPKKEEKDYNCSIAATLDEKRRKEREEISGIEGKPKCELTLNQLISPASQTGPIHTGRRTDSITPQSQIKKRQPIQSNSLEEEIVNNSSKCDLAKSARHLSPLKTGVSFKDISESSENELTTPESKKINVVTILQQEELNQSTKMTDGAKVAPIKNRPTFLPTLPVVGLSEQTEYDIDQLTPPLNIATSSKSDGNLSSCISGISSEDMENIVSNINSDEEEDDDDQDDAYKVNKGQQLQSAFIDHQQKLRNMSKTSPTGGIRFNIFQQQNSRCGMFPPPAMLLSKTGVLSPVDVVSPILGPNMCIKTERPIDAILGRVIPPKVPINHSENVFTRQCQVPKMNSTDFRQCSPRHHTDSSSSTYPFRNENCCGSMSSERTKRKTRNGPMNNPNTARGDTLDSFDGKQNHALEMELERRRTLGLGRTSDKYRSEKLLRDTLTGANGSMGENNNRGRSWSVRDGSDIRSFPAFPYSQT